MLVFCFDADSWWVRNCSFKVGSVSKGSNRVSSTWGVFGKNFIEVMGNLA